MHPSASAQTESRLNSRHVSFRFEPNLEMRHIRDAEGNQVRMSEHRAPRATVDRYAEQMKAGPVFPAIVVNERYEIVDGNSRWMAALRNKRDTIAAYICSDLSALQARSLSVELNQSHGLSMTDDELRSFVAGAVEEGQVLDPKAYARMTGVKSSTLARWVAAKHFDIRVKRAGLSFARFERLADSIKLVLNAAKLEAVFVQATALAADAAVPTNQLKIIVREANAASSEAEALSVIAQARALRSDDIKTIAAGFKTVARRSKGSALHMSGLLRYQITDLLDVSPEKQGEMYARMSSLRERLDAALIQARITWNLADINEFSNNSSAQSGGLGQIG